MGAGTAVEIVWEDPPAKKWRGGGTLDPRWETMRQNPGRWVLWGREMVMPTANLVRRHPGFEAVGRNFRQDGTRCLRDIYVRYVGEAS